jgi:hypothetical protein
MCGILAVAYKRVKSGESPIVEFDYSTNVLFNSASMSKDDSAKTGVFLTRITPIGQWRE